MSMEWEDLEPIAKVVPWAQASVYVNNDGKPRIRVFFSEAMLNACGHPKAANVQFGVRDGKAMVRCIWDDGGKFNVGDLGRGGARIQNIPSKAPAPDGARDNEPCEIETKTPQEAILILPLAAWEAQLSKPVVIERKSAQEAPKPPAAVRQSQPIEAVVYLRAKGVKILKLAGDWWMLMGNKVPRMEVLACVNEHRKAAGLPALGIDQIE